MILQVTSIPHRITVGGGGVCGDDISTDYNNILKQEKKNNKQPEKVWVDK